MHSDPKDYISMALICIFFFMCLVLADQRSQRDKTIRELQIELSLSNVALKTTQNTANACQAELDSYTYQPDPMELN